MKNKRKKHDDKLLNELLTLFETAIITLFVILLIFTYVLKIVIVDGESMQNTLFQDDAIVVSLLYSEPEAGDIVIINADDAVLMNSDNTLRYEVGLGKKIVKRVIATGGQTVDIDFEKGAVYVDGVMLEESYVTGLTHLDEGAFTDQYPVTVPEGYVFVMGDNRAYSKDSRSLEIGFIEVDSIVGRVFFRLSPISEFGFVD
ncbi:MAG: signal peptidase I [Ruminococcus sp.]|nr:signal peptidase I [Ruminococcus sp.]